MSSGGPWAAIGGRDKRQRKPMTAPAGLCCFILHPQHPTEGSLHRHLGLNGHESLIHISVTAERLVLGPSSFVIYVDVPAAIEQIVRAGPACREIA